MSRRGWVTGGVRRAVTSVRSALPGHGSSAAEPASVVREGPAESAGAAPAPAGQGAPTSTAQGRATVSGGAATKAATKAAPDVAPKPAPKAATKAAPRSAAKPAPKAAKKAAPRSAPKAAPRSAAKPAPKGAAPVASPWTAEELAAFRTALEADIVRLREELNMGEADMAELIADSSDGAGDDQADAGSKTLEREQEMSVTANARELLDQSTHAMVRLESGTYGVCEGCGSVIPGARLRAFPRATRCIACKQAEERR